MENAAHGADSAGGAVVLQRYIHTTNTNSLPGNPLEEKKPRQRSSTY